MRKKTTFETDRLLVRGLLINDLYPFHEMQSNPLVMQYVTGIIKPLAENKKELIDLIAKYDHPENDFFIYAIERKCDAEFIGSVALIKDDQNDDELGYRFLQKYWGNGYGFEVCKGLVKYCQSSGFPKLVGYVVDANIASARILEKCNFRVVSKGMAPDLQLPETKYELIL
ncbi:MAG: GNAT family N-acetyltransferase [Flavobacteriaceae bacterium]|nr:MAG: GNAT family N-acetyltransferase [Flavobacteriaceae bacterium]